MRARLTLLFLATFFAFTVVAQEIPKRDAPTETEQLRRDKLELRESARQAQFRAIQLQAEILGREAQDIQREAAILDAEILKAHKAPDGSRIQWPAKQQDGSLVPASPIIIVPEKKTKEVPAAKP